MPSAVANTPKRPGPPLQDEGRPGRSPRTVVVGAGLGGIAAALRLRALGDHVTLIDRLPDLGGRARVFRRDGYTFDAGPTVITAPHLFEELFQLFGERLEDVVRLVPVDPWYRIQFSDRTTFDYSGDLERTLEQIRVIEPRDVDGYLRMLRACESIYRIGYEELGAQPFHTLWSMARALPSMVRLRSFRSTYQFAAAHLRSDKLRRVFSFQPLLVGGNPLTTTSIYSLIHIVERRFGVHYAMGGTGALVEALRGLMERVGVEVALGEGASRIETRAGAVRAVVTDDGRRLPADRVVTNCDPTTVYQRLLAHEPDAEPVRRKAAKMRQSMGLVVLYFGSKRPYPDLAHHTILLSDRYADLLKDIFDRGRTPHDPSLYVHAPTRTDPALAPPGRECFYVLAPVPNLDAGVDWSVEGGRYRDLILDRVERELAPGLTAEIESCAHVTPEYFRDELLSPLGAGFSAQPLLTQSAYFRFHNRCPKLRGLFLTGAGTHPGAGLPGVLTSAKVVETLVREETAA